MRIKLRVAIPELGLAAGDEIATPALTAEHRLWIAEGLAEMGREDSTETAVLPPAPETTAAGRGAHAPGRAVNSVLEHDNNDTP